MPEAQPPQLMTHPQAPHAPPLGGVMAKWLAPTTESRIERIPCESIRQRPWLTEPDAEEILAPLRDSIGARGVVEPLLLRRHPHGGFEIVCGARRLRAAIEMRLTHVPAIVRDLTLHEAVLVAAWSTVERRRAAGSGDAFTAAVLSAGLSVEEMHAVLAAPERRPGTVLMGPPALFLLLASPLSRPRSAPTFATFDSPHSGVLPLPASRERTAALAALLSTRPSALLS
ncbi:MAG: hypothetical protein E6I33_00365 [Chloroflexi bacterium]|nr:MAG: hypothetical protein E6I55_03450 [Chloroflexota bacterium]TMF18146.1 MAG: hypothetical protein E6I33_00365 [Chloroflexota bacterium]